MLNIEKYQNEIRERLDYCKYIEARSDEMWRFLGEALYNTADLPLEKEIGPNKSQNLALDVFEWLLADYIEHQVEEKTNVFTTLEIKSFNYDSKEIFFKTPYKALVKTEKYGLTVDDELWNIYCIEDDLDKLEIALKEELAFIYESYVLCDEKILSDKAKQLKESFLKKII